MGTWMLALSASAQAADVYVNGNDLLQSAITKNAVAREGTGTCAEGFKQGLTRQQLELGKLQLLQVRQMLQATETLEQKQMMLEQIMSVLEAE